MSSNASDGEFLEVGMTLVFGRVSSFLIATSNHLISKILWRLTNAFTLLLIVAVAHQIGGGWMSMDLDDIIRGEPEYSLWQTRDRRCYDYAKS